MGNFSHSSLQILSSSVRLDVEHCYTDIFRCLQRCSIGFKSGLWLKHWDLSRSQSWVVLAVCLRSLSCWKMNVCPSLRSWLFCFHQGYLCAPFIFPLILTSLPDPAAEKLCHSMMLPPCFTVGMVPGFLQTWRLAFRPKSSILVSSDQRILFPMVWESLGAFWQTSSGLTCAFYWGWLFFRKVLPSPQRNSELCQSDHRVLGHNPDQGSFPPIGQFGQVVSSRKSLGDSKLLHLRVMEATVFLGIFNSADSFWYPSPDLCLDTILSRSSMDNSFDLMAWFLPWHALSTVGPHIDRCVPFQIMSNQLNLPQVDSNQVVLFFI